MPCALEPGDRVLFYTDGITEQHLPGGEEFGEDRFVEVLERITLDGGAVQETRSPPVPRPPPRPWGRNE